MLIDCLDCEGKGETLLFHQFHTCKTCKGAKKVENNEEPLSDTISDDDDDYYYAMGIF